MMVWMGASPGATNTKAGGGNTKTFHLGVMAKHFQYRKVYVQCPPRPLASKTTRSARST